MFIKRTKYLDTIIHMGFSVKNRQQLVDIINKLKSLPDVHDVLR